MKFPKTARATLALAALTALGALGLSAPAGALGAPALKAEMSHLPSSVSAVLAPRPGIPLGGRGKYTVAVSNTGDAATSGPVSVTVSIPAGLHATAATDEALGQNFGLQPSAWNCSVAPGGATVSCAGPKTFLGSELPIPAGQEACSSSLGFTCRIVVTVAPDPGAEDGDIVTPSAEACGGGAAACASVSDPVEIVPHFEVTHFDAGTFEGNLDPRSEANYDPAMEQSGEPETQAGAHPQSASTLFYLTQTAAKDGWLYSTGDLKDAVVKLPPGVIANARAVPTCSDAELSSGSSAPDCPIASQVGVVDVYFFGNTPTKPGIVRRSYVELFNMEAPEGKYALLGFNVLGAVYHITGRLVKDPSAAGGYRAEVGLLNTPQVAPLAGSAVTVWGVPADPSHDVERGHGTGFEHTYNADLYGMSCIVPSTGTDTCPAEGTPAGVAPKPFFTLPTACEGPVTTDIDVTSWQGDEASSSVLSHDNTKPTPQPIGISGCNTLEFDPTLEARPTTNVADSASGLNFNLHIPQNEDPDGNATANLKDTTVTLPEGMTINPSGANGLGACSPAQAGLGDEQPTGCPDDSKVGTVEVETPLLDHPAKGSVFVATPFDNPFDSLLALYITVEDPQTGTNVKLAGRVQLDPETGQLTTTVEENPQVPFEDFKLKFFGGAGGPLRTPSVCGAYSTTSSLTPWSAPDSGPPATPADNWQIEQSPNGGGCPGSESAKPNAPQFDAGAVSPIAGTNTPMVINLRRQDATQEFSSVTLTPPPGVVGKLAGIPYCPDSALAAAAAKTGKEEQGSPSCPDASYVGSVVAGAGAGPAPYYAPGKAYLTGPYKGAPISLAIVTPAVAGPFDLGTVVVRTALFVNPVTAQITAVSDPLPRILQGIPLDIRSIQVKLDRPDFTITPTSCDPMSFAGGLTSTLGQTAPLQSRFQLGECGRLGFKPNLSLTLKGGTKRNGHPALTAVLTTRPGDANLSSISVALPHSEFLDQGHIRTVCTRVQFAANACPEAAIYGQATVTTPLLDYPLSGPVYLRSSDNPLPDLVPDLRGPANQPIKLESSGRVDSVRGGIRNSFELVPDAPFTKLVLEMQGGKKGLLVNSRDICKKTFRATVKYRAHNGLTLDASPKLKASCKKKPNRRAARKHRAKR